MFIVADEDLLAPVLDGILAAMNNHNKKVSTVTLLTILLLVQKNLLLLRKGKYTFLCPLGFVFPLGVLKLPVRVLKLSVWAAESTWFLATMITACAKELALLQAWNAGDVSSPGRSRRVTRLQRQSFSRMPTL